MDITGGDRRVRVPGMGLVFRLGGMAVGGGDHGMAVVLGPNVMCEHPVESYLGAQGRVFVRAEAPWLRGAQWLILDTGLGSDFAFRDAALARVPARWRVEGRDDHELLYHAPSMPGLGLAGPETRHVQLYQQGGPHPRSGARAAGSATAPSRPTPSASSPTRPW